MDNTKDCFVKVKDLTRVLVFLMGFCGGVIFITVIFFSAIRHSKHHRDNHKLRQAEMQGALQKSHSLNETFHKGEDVIAQKLSGKVRVLCLVLTAESSYATSGAAVKNTWGSRCNTLLFVSDFEDSSLPVVKMYAGAENKLRNWALVKSALKHIYIHYMDSHDWVFRVTDHTFAVVENLRYLLSTNDPSKPFYLGCRFKKFVKQGFMSGGAGYVLSREAVSRMVKDGLTKGICNPKDDATEDVEMGRCMEKLNVEPVDTRDSLGRGRFFPFSPEKHLIPEAIDKTSWYWDMVYYPPHSGFDCCSDSAVSFSGISAQRMYVMNYLVYHLRPYGISSHHPLNQTNLYIVIK